MFLCLFVCLYMSRQEEESLRDKIRADHERALQEAKEKLRKSKEEIHAEIQTEKTKVACWTSASDWAGFTLDLCCRPRYSIKLFFCSSSEGGGSFGTASPSPSCFSSAALIPGLSAPVRSSALGV